jgi:CubicO group peptidase (beta-lactamase class C family)
MSTAAALASPVLAAAPDNAIDATVEAYMQERKIPGLLLGIMQDGRTVVRKAYGLSDLELGVPARPEHIYQSGSTGKMFTATAIMQLVADGRVALDAPVGRYLKTAPALWSAITVEQLMRHRSGVPDYDGADFNVALEWPAEAFIARLGTWPLDFAPGTRFSYSNSGYVLLGFIIEAVTGKPYGVHLAERVFAPAGMKTARVNDNDAIITGRARGYRLDENGVLIRPEIVSQTANQFADGSLLYSLDDLIAWERAVAANTVLPPDAQAFIERAPLFPDGTKPAENYGAGWETRIVRGHREVSHGGVWQGFSAWIGRWPEKRLAMMMLANHERGHPGGLAPRLAGLFDPALGPYVPVKDDAPHRTVRDRARLADYFTGAEKPGASAQQRRDAFLGPLKTGDVFALVDATRDARVYRFGEAKGRMLAIFDRRGGIGFEVAQ